MGVGVNGVIGSIVMSVVVEGCRVGTGPVSIQHMVDSLVKEMSWTTMSVELTHVQVCSIVEPVKSGNSQNEGQHWGSVKLSLHQEYKHCYIRGIPSQHLLPN